MDGSSPWGNRMEESPGRVGSYKGRESADFPVGGGSVRRSPPFPFACTYLAETCINGILGTAFFGLRAEVGAMITAKCPMCEGEHFYVGTR